MPDFVSRLLGKSRRKIGQLFRKAAKKSGMDYSLFDRQGRRKYLVPTERRRFLQAALDVGGPTASFCAAIALTGMRMSEALALTPSRVDVEMKCINVETLKQRRRGIFRAIPVPKELIFFMDAVHHITDARPDPERADARLWTWSRSTGWRRIKKVMVLAAAPTYASNSRSLRHALGVEASLEGVVLTMIQRWFGHTDIRTTAIYTTVVGEEERRLAARTSRSLVELLRSDCKRCAPQAPKRGARPQRQNTRSKKAGS
jgi:integrase/recombinase XerD